MGDNDVNNLAGKGLFLFDVAMMTEDKGICALAVVIFGSMGDKRELLS